MATRVSRWSERNAYTGDHLDLRSWTVRTGQDREDVGKVAEILLDEDGAPRYLEIKLSETSRTVLVPAGHASTDPDEEVVWIPGFQRGNMTDIPDWQARETLDPDYERQLASAYDDGYSGEGFYDSPHFRTQSDGRERRGKVSAAPARVDSLDDIDVADHDPDPRGWPVVGRDGEEFGHIDHLLGDTNAMKVRYFVVELTAEDVEDRRHVLVPAGHVELQVDEERCRVPALERGLLLDYPRWRGDNVDRNHEQKVARYVDEAYDDDSRARHPRYRAAGLRRS